MPCEARVGKATSIGCARLDSASRQSGRAVPPVGAGSRSGDPSHVPIPIRGHVLKTDETRYCHGMEDLHRRLAEAYAKVSAAGLKAMATEQSAEAAVNQAHTAMALANSAAKSAADARGAARQVSLALGAVLDILDADEGVAT